MLIQSLTFWMNCQMDLHEAPFASTSSTQGFDSLLYIFTNTCSCFLIIATNRYEIRCHPKTQAIQISTSDVCGSPSAPPLNHSQWESHLLSGRDNVGESRCRAVSFYSNRWKWSKEIGRNWGLLQLPWGEGRGHWQGSLLQVARRWPCLESSSHTDPRVLNHRNCKVNKCVLF